MAPIIVFPMLCYVIAAYAMVGACCQRFLCDLLIQPLVRMDDAFACCQALLTRLSAFVAYRVFLIDVSSLGLPRLRPMHCVLLMNVAYESFASRTK